MTDYINSFLVSFGMFIGCYIAGLIPMSLGLSETRIRQTSVFGAGLLIGTALAVIIPEGLSLVIGFVFMLLVDQIGSKHTHSHSHSGIMGDSSEDAFIELRNLTTTDDDVILSDYEEDQEAEQMEMDQADGVAMGAAIFSKKSDVEVIVFIAIMLHKAPAAFGLVSFLLHESLERSLIRKHLFVFSLAAPVACIGTYMTLLYINDIPMLKFGTSLASGNATGLAMLFSAGTFLYVATVHVLPEIERQSVLSRGELLAIVFGAVLPCVLSFNHHH